jgi:ABC-type sugar transport system ATPase subunit
MAIPRRYRDSTSRWRRASSSPARPFGLRQDHHPADDRGLRAVSGGRIELDGRDITHAKPNTRGLGIVFQTYALFPHMTVEQNVAFGLEMRKCGPPSATAWRRPWRWCTWKSTAPATRASSPAASASAWRWRVRW